MIVEIIKRGKNIKFYCVDTWEGSKEHKHLSEVIDNTVFDIFRHNLKSVEKCYTAIRKPSIEAAKDFEDESIEFLFLDASHEKKDLLDDIKAWLPKVKKGGIIAGHDYDYPDVKAAVDECFSKVISRETCWEYTKQ